MVEVAFRWWEVQFTDKRDAPLLSSTALTASVEVLSIDDVDKDEKGKPAESMHFIESDLFCVVKTATDEPIDAIKRALLLMQPDIMAAKEDVQWQAIDF